MQGCNGFSQFGRWLLAPLFLLAIAGAEPAYSSSVTEVGLGDMAAASELVFEGRVIGVESSWTEDGRAIRTTVTFEVLDVLKGSAGTTVTLNFLGGAIGDLRLSVTDLNLPVPGEKGVYFVETTGQDQVNPLYGWSQGHFLLVRDPSGRGERVLTADARPVMGLERDNVFAKSSGISDGVAQGVITGDETVVRDALSREAFKEALRNLVLAGA